MLFTSALLARLTDYFALDFGQSDANWLSNPAAAKNNSDAKLVRNSSDTDWFMGEFPLALLFKYFSDTSILEKIKSKGYNVEFELNTVDPFVHKITLADRSKGIIEVIFQGFYRRKLYQLQDFKTFQRLGRSTAPISSFIPQISTGRLIDQLRQLYGSLAISSTTIEWMCLQDPRAKFTYQRPQLPGQQYPGLAMSNDILSLTITMAREQLRDAVCVQPDHFHNALFFQRKGFIYLNPAYQAVFDVLCENLEDDIRTHGLAYVSWAIQYGYVKDCNGSAFSWQLEEQLYPVSDKLRAVFDSLAYWDIYSQYKQQCSAYFLNHQETIAIAQYSCTKQKLVKYHHTVIGGLHRRSSSHNFQMLDAWNQAGARPDSVC
ncbi:hypothetical protein BC943DRAFT_340264 [Umbelopsis sp. AD052]|nr:hypothetical protein BC943DRAFT_340264 [Umbelopsis sp. AD052]